MKFKSILVIAAVLTVAPRLFAHCDSISGPVIADARSALAKGAVTSVLKWVPAEAEQEIRDAFTRTMAARAASPEARDVADRWFFETLVRVHRASEGAPFTGLQGADFKPEGGIELADEAIESGTLDAARKAVLDDITAGLSSRFAAVIEAKKHADETVADGRKYVRAYVEFIHYVERIHASATTAAAHDAGNAHAEH
jgi:hypothetical protein